MRKIFFLLIILKLNLFADISQKQLDEYLKISRGEQVLNFYQKILSRGVSNSVNVKDRNLLMKKLLAISKEAMFVRKYTKEFMKLDETTYNKIMKFYKTEEGMKSVSATINFSGLDNNKKELKDIFKQCKDLFSEDCFKYINLKELESFPYNKKILMEQVAKEFDIIKIKRNIRRQSLLSMNLAYKKSYKYSDEFIKKYATYNDVNYHKITSNITYLFFKDFSQDELQKIVNYAQSDAAKEEYILIENGIKQYTDEFFRIIMRVYFPDKCVELK